MGPLPLTVNLGREVYFNSGYQRGGTSDTVLRGGVLKNK